MSMSDISKPVKMRPWLRVVLFGSLALNLLVIGLMVGALSHGRAASPWVRKGGDPVTPYTRAFDEDQRKELRSALRSTLGKKPPKDGRGILSGYQSALGVLRSDPFDRAALLASLEAQSASNADRRKRGQEVLVDFISDMTPQERAIFADRLEDELTSWRERRDKWRDKDRHKPHRHRDD
jgi:uncharacterized membrane protein